MLPQESTKILESSREASAEVAENLPHEIKVNAKVKDSHPRNEINVTEEAKSPV